MSTFTMDNGAVPNGDAGDPPGCHVLLTHSPLSITSTIDLVRSPAAGAIVVFIGTTRCTTASRRVQRLHYTAYLPRAERSMRAICADVRTAHKGLVAVAMAHRLGDVPVGEESVVIAVAGTHRAEAWRGAQEALEECKTRVEIWKREWLGEGEEGHGGAAANGLEREGEGASGAGVEEEMGIWRANADLQ